MKKIIAILIGIIGISNIMFAQYVSTALLPNEEFFKNSDFIVKGKLIRWNDYDLATRAYDIKGNYNPKDIYTEYLFKVDAVYKSYDNLIKLSDTIVIIADRGSIRKIESTSGEWTFWEEVKKNSNKGPMDLNGSSEFVLFLNKTVLPVNPFDKNSYFHTEFLSDCTYGRLKIFGYIIGLNDLVFENRYELYKYMEQFEGITLPLSDPTKMKNEVDDDTFNKYLKERNIKWGKTKEQNDSIKNYILKLHEELMQNAKKKVLNEPKANNNITFSISDQEQTYSNDKYYFEFDVNIYANN
jgi:hypothetical protein